ncbi:DEP domain-containing protein 5 [Portunus trituberculatus]|uniref:DEP domain-containing protein 5 n=1 Tax=Portunus trituberculatus TaxID=210409 RepID=A0A5B7DK66_PORTR|nr:DEP domain-containing protein 5 [Portunus trituberculatus]
MVTWQRKAQACGLHLFPVPSDPFALPYSCNSDPLRGPILVPLNVSCFTLPGSEPFAQFPADTWGRRMHLFQPPTRTRTFSTSSASQLNQPGFLWTFNYMLTRRWKVPQISGDEVLAEKMLHDFRLFCANDRNRLRDFWDSHLPLLAPTSPTDDLMSEP